MACLTLVNVGFIAYQTRLSRGNPPVGEPSSKRAGRPPVTITSADYRPLFSALVSMQADPSTSLTPSQRERIVPLLRRWEEHVHTLESEVVVIFEGRINNLGAARRRAFLDAQDRLSKVASADLPPPWDAVIASLEQRSRSASLPAVEATDGDGSWMGAPGRRVNLRPTIAMGALLSLLGTPSFALSPQEASRLLGTVCAWRDHDEAMTALVAEMEKGLTNEQGAEVSRRRQSAQERTRAIHAFHVLEALGEGPQGSASAR